MRAWDWVAATLAFLVAGASALVLGVSGALWLAERLSDVTRVQAGMAALSAGLFGLPIWVAAVVAHVRK